MNENEANYAGQVQTSCQPVPPRSIDDCLKVASGTGASYIDHAPDKQVVLSARLEYLARRVGGCQTEELLALLRGIMFEVISQRKY